MVLLLDRMNRYETARRALRCRATLRALSSRPTTQCESGRGRFRGSVVLVHGFRVSEMDFQYTHVVCVFSCLPVCMQMYSCLYVCCVCVYQSVSLSVCLSVCMQHVFVPIRTLKILFKASILGARMCQGWGVFVHLRKCMSIYDKCMYSGLITRSGGIIAEHFRLRAPAAVSAYCLPMKMRTTITLFLILHIWKISPLARALQPSSSRVDARMTINFRL